MSKRHWVKDHGSDLALILFILIIALMPAVVGQYNTDTILRIMINTILVVGFRLISTCGLWSFAHVGFMSVGAYSVTLLVTKAGISFWGALPLSLIIGGVAAYILSFPLLRTKSFVFFLASYAIGQAILWVWILFFGGFSGLASPRPTPLPFLPSIEFNTVLPMYYLVFIFTVISLFIMYRIEKSKIGVNMKAVASNEILSQSAGINALQYKRLAFIIGSTAAALAGVFWAVYTGTVQPTAFPISYSMNVLMWTIIGGLQSFAGPIIGLVLMTFLGDLLSKHLLQYLPLVYGGVFIVVILTLKGGLIRLFEMIWGKALTIVRRNHDAARPATGKDNV
ncbi:branched-chain amino acid ABC transporter permease [Chloroflexota bacterium]